MQPTPLDAPSKRFLLCNLPCKYCGAVGVELTTLVMYTMNGTKKIHSLICVPCNRMIRTGGRIKDGWERRTVPALGGRALLYEATTRIRLNGP